MELGRYFGPGFAFERVHSTSLPLEGEGLEVFVGEDLCAYVTSDAVYALDCEAEEVWRAKPGPGEISRLLGRLGGETPWLKPL